MLQKRRKPKTLRYEKDIKDGYQNICNEIKDNKKWRWH